MLSAAATSNPKDPPSRRETAQPADVAKDAAPPNAKRDPSADFIQDLAESGTANELSTVKAAADAAESAEIEGGEGDDERQRRHDRKTASRKADR